MKINKLLRFFGFVECNKCKKVFWRTKNTSVGYVNGVNVHYYCIDCSSNIVADAFNNKNPFEKAQKEIEVKE